MKNRVITISREFGSGGRTIGRKVAERLKIPCYDSELIHKIAQESGFAEGYIKMPESMRPADFWLLLCPAAPSDRPTKTISGIFSRELLRIWRKRNPV